jgi:1-aminocyclopropane-1-carboxylate deaminase/D-cysteine desulfhydrase-like pyridoxal-dependent ACC family enzyme
MQKLLEILQIPSPLQKVEYSDWNKNGIEVYFKRDDLIHPSISGNKWRKLIWSSSKISGRKLSWHYHVWRSIF